MNDFLLAQMISAERLPASHEAKSAVLSELKNSLAGASGEKRTAALLKRELDLPGDVAFLRDVHIPYKDGAAGRCAWKASDCRGPGAAARVFRPRLSLTAPQMGKTAPREAITAPQTAKTAPHEQNTAPRTQKNRTSQTIHKPPTTDFSKHDIFY